jgi:DNA polymerase III epsilon subunit-like protein
LRTKIQKRKADQVSFKIKPFQDMVIFDLETTGLAYRADAYKGISTPKASASTGGFGTGAEIIQIAAVRMRDGEIVEEDSFFSYVKPRQPLDAFIIEYTGITEKDVRNAPWPKEVLPQFFNYCRESLLVAHNGQSFDIPKLRSVCEQYGLKARKTDSIDSMHLSWKLWGRRKVRSHGLDAVMARVNGFDSLRSLTAGVWKEGIRRHDARGDVLATARCVRHMVNELEKRPEPLSLNINDCLFPN